jgi:large subunit ribosomal protein L10
MENPRPEKVAVVDEVRERFSASSGALLTEYRGLTVDQMSTLRRSLREAGGSYKIYKNSLVRFAARDLGFELDELLTGPTAIAFVDGDPVNVAKALRDFARTNEHLIVKGGMLGDKLLSAAEAKALADVAPREELLARLAGAMAAPMQQFAGLLQAIPRSFAYGLAALIDQQGGVPDVAEPAETAEVETAEPETAEPETAEPETAEPETATAETVEASDDTPTEAPAATDEAPAESTETTTDDDAAPAAADETETVADAADITTEES